MAQVSISFGDISIGIEDEDESAKKLTALAVKTVTTIVAEFGIPEKGEEEPDSDDEKPWTCTGCGIKLADEDTHACAALLRDRATDG